jgi:hypothetical protein
VLASTTYVIEEIVIPPIGSPYIDYHAVDAPVLIAYARGTNGGRVIYSGLELSPNYDAGGLAREYVDAVLDPVIFKERDEEDILDALDGGDYGGNYPSSPTAMSQKNLNMAVAAGGITLDNASANSDTSFAFVVSERRAYSTAPQIDSSGASELIVSLYTPAGELYSTRKAIGGYNAVSIGVPAGDLQTGRWKYVVEEVHGFDGDRVVLLAAIDGIYDMYDPEWNGEGGGGNDGGPYDIIVRSLHASDTRGEGTVRSYSGGSGGGTLDPSASEVFFGPLHSPDMIEVWRVDDDLVMDVKGTDDSVAVPGWFKSRNTLTVYFRDGTEWSAADLADMAETREPDINFLVVSTDHYVSGTEGNDTYTGNDGSTLFLPDKGDDSLTFSGGNNTLYYRMDEGHDTITINGPADTYSAIRFHSDITSSDVTVSRCGSDLTLNAAAGSVTVKGWYDAPEKRIDLVQFAGHDDVWDARDVEKLERGETLTARTVKMTFGNSGKDDDTSGLGSSSGCDSGAAFLAASGLLAAALINKGRT